MKRFLLLLIGLGTALGVFAQSGLYSSAIKKGDSLFRVKDYQDAAFTYATAFNIKGAVVSLNDRWSAASAWALANFPDSAFLQLELMANMKFKDYGRITTDQDLVSLHGYKRWYNFTELVKMNKQKAEANLNRPLAAQLDSIFINDRKYRQQTNEIDKKYGWQSAESKAIWERIRQQDSANQVAVRAILDMYGWLGADVVGDNGNSALFLVIQHSDPVTQQKYLPMIKEAVKNGKARGSSYALLQDRVLVGQGKMQVYGTQPYHDSTGYYMNPIEDVDNVDKRRAEMGLQPLAEYVQTWHMVWNVEQYKKDLPKSPALKRMNELAAYLDSLKK